MYLLEITIQEERKKSESEELENIKQEYEALMNEYEELKNILDNRNKFNHTLLSCEMQKTQKLRDMNETYKEKLNTSKQDNIELKKEIDKLNELYSRQTQIMLKQSMTNYEKELFDENKSLQNNLEKYEFELKLVREENTKLKQSIEKNNLEDYQLYDFVNDNTGQPSHIYARDLKEALKIKKIIEHDMNRTTIIRDKIKTQEKQFNELCQLFIDELEKMKERD